MVRLLKTAHEKLFVLIRWALFLVLLAVWGAVAIAFIVVTLGCVLFGVNLVLMPFLGRDESSMSAFLAALLSVLFVFRRFVTIFKKEAKWVPFGRWLEFGAPWKFRGGGLQ